MLTFGGGKYEYFALEFTRVVKPLRVLIAGIDIVLNEEVKNEQNVLGVSRLNTKEETKKPTVEMPTGRIVDGNVFVETLFNTVLK